MAENTRTSARDFMSEVVEQVKKVTWPDRAQLQNSTGIIVVFILAVAGLIWLLDACSAVVASDTGPVHIARALETPVVGLYGHTNPWRVGPYRAYEDLWVDAYTDGAPDPSNAEPKLDRMERITSQMVIERLDRALHG